MSAFRAALPAWLAATAAVVVATAAAAAAMAMPQGFGTPPSRPGEAARIFGGLNATAHEFPTQVYIVSLLQNDDSPRLSGLFCGGTILSEKWILTAAHCVKQSVRTVVGFGTANKNKLDYGVAARVIPHENYTLYGRNLNNAANDLGLVELADPIIIDGISTAAAVLPDYWHHPRPTGKGDVVIGWGRWTYDPLKDHPGSTVVLKKLGVHVFHCPHDVPKVICLQTDTGTGICDGDSGGPLLVNGVFYGVASYVDNIDPDPNLDPNEHCNDAGSYAVYMSVLAHREWIRWHTGV